MESHISLDAHHTTILETRNRCAFTDWLEREIKNYWDLHSQEVGDIGLRQAIDCYLKIIPEAVHHEAIEQLPETIEQIQLDCISDHFTRRSLSELAVKVLTKFESFLRLVSFLVNRLNNSHHHKGKDVRTWNHWDFVMVLGLVDSKYITDRKLTSNDVPQDNCQQLICRLIEARNTIHVDKNHSNLSLLTWIVEGLFVHIFVTARYFPQLSEAIRLSHAGRERLQHKRNTLRESLPSPCIDITLEDRTRHIVTQSMLSQNIINGSGKPSCTVILGDSGTGKSTLCTHLAIDQIETFLQSGTIDEPISLDAAYFTPDRGLFPALALRLGCENDKVVPLLNGGNRCIFIDSIEQLPRERSCRVTFVRDVAALLNEVNELAIILFSRIHDYESCFCPELDVFINPDVLVIRPLTDEQVGMILGSYGIYECESVISWIKESQTPDLFATPQSVTMLAQISILDAIHSPNDLTRLFVEERLKAEKKIARSLWPYCLRLLNRLSQIDAMDISLQEIEDALRVIDPPSDKREDIFLQTVNTGLLRAVREGSYDFAHNRFREYFLNVDG